MNMEIGKTVEFSKTISEDDIKKMVEISGDDNPIHLDEEFAKRTIYRGRIAHGLLSLGLVSAALTKLFGPGNIWLNQTFSFTKPIHAGDTLTAKLKIISIDKRKVCTVETLVYNQNDELVLEGKAESKVAYIKKK
ncbi:MAG: MaoC family dehydratase [Candidatus Helarchaeota archaeon]|nr:MaoC family dehydratase [Candidatus Helarchaeota archaeon]